MAGRALALNALEQAVQRTPGGGSSFRAPRRALSALRNVDGERDVRATRQNEVPLVRRQIGELARGGDCACAEWSDNPLDLLRFHNVALQERRVQQARFSARFATQHCMLPWERAHMDGDASPLRTWEKVYWLLCPVLGVSGLVYELRYSSVNALSIRRRQAAQSGTMADNEARSFDEPRDESTAYTF